ncbi:MAG TPA: TOBE-like domain-containing protein, partial [Acidimicrobiales bacterium]|nr:TOBE-like domain-containing protein [Acidimicrobiales bacterium]
LGDSLVRPHDLEVLLEGEPDAVPATVERVVRLGFEVRVDLRSGDDELWVQLTRGEAERLALSVGRAVYVRPVIGATMTAVGAMTAEAAALVLSEVPPG